MARFVLQIENLEAGTSEERTFEESPVRLGRHARNEVSLDFAFVSQWHGVFRFDEEQCFYVDQGSTNGSFLNGRRLGVAEERPIGAQDELRIGVVRLRGRVGEAGRGMASSASRGAVPPMLGVPPAVPGMPVRREPPSRVQPPEPRSSARTFSKTPVVPVVPTAPPAQRAVAITQAESRFRTRIKEVLSPELVPATEPEWDELLVRLLDSVERLGEIVVADHAEDEQLQRALIDGGSADWPATQRLLGFLLDIRAPANGPVRLLKSLLDAEADQP